MKKKWIEHLSGGVAELCTRSFELIVEGQWSVSTREAHSTCRVKDAGACRPIFHVFTVEDINLSLNKLKCRHGFPLTRSEMSVIHPFWNELHFPSLYICILASLASAVPSGRTGAFSLLPLVLWHSNPSVLGAVHSLAFFWAINLNRLRWRSFPHSVKSRVITRLSATSLRVCMDRYKEAKGKRGEQRASIKSRRQRWTQDFSHPNSHFNCCRHSSSFAVLWYRFYFCPDPHECGQWGSVKKISSSSALWESNGTNKQLIWV